MHQHYNEVINESLRILDEDGEQANPDSIKIAFEKLREDFSDLGRSMAKKGVDFFFNIMKTIAEAEEKMQWLVSKDPSINTSFDLMTKIKNIKQSIRDAKNNIDEAASSIAMCLDKVFGEKEEAEDVKAASVPETEHKEHH
jgi:hypothetical protein